MVINNYEFAVIFTVHIFYLLFLRYLPLTFHINKGLVMMKSFNLTLSEKHFIFPSILNDSFAGYSLSLIHISEPTRRVDGSRMPSSA